MSQIATTAPKTHGIPVVLSGVAQLGRLARLWAARRRGRIALAHLDPHLIRDIGLDALSRDAEAHRPFWR